MNPLKTKPQKNSAQSVFHHSSLATVLVVCTLLLLISHATQAEDMIDTVENAVSRYINKLFRAIQNLAAGLLAIWALVGGIRLAIASKNDDPNISNKVKNYFIGLALGALAFIIAAAIQRYTH